MPRKTTPDLLVDILDVSQETLTPQRPASTRLVDVFAAMDGTAPVAIYGAERTPDLVPIAHIDDNPYQPRLTYSGIEELAENIRLNGLLQPPAGRTVRGGRWMSKSTFKPPPWPVDGFAPRSPDVRGECAGCAWLVAFDREPAPRCMDKKCYMAKERLWKDEDGKRQKAAARAAIAGQVDTSTAPAKEPRWTTKDGYITTAFGEANAPAALLERGLCGAEQCECFALMLRKNDYDLSKRMVGPDRQTAPNVVYVCENSSRLRAKRNRLEEIEAPEKAQQRKEEVADKGAETKAAKALLKELWAGIGVEGLSGSQSAMATIAAAVSGSYFSEAKWREQSVPDLWDDIFWHIAGKSCKAVDFTSEGNRSERWVLAKAEQLRDQLRGERSRPATQPGPGDSQETGWQEWWDEDDQRYWSNLAGMEERRFEQNVVNAIDRPRILLRLIEMQGDKGQRAALWQRYNELTAPADEESNGTNV